MTQFRHYIALLCLFTSSLAMSTVETTTHRNIVEIRVTTTDNLDPLQQGIMLLQVDGPALQYNCSYLGIGKNNSYAVSALLAAHFAKKPVRFWFTFDASVYGNGVCQVETFSVL